MQSSDSEPEVAIRKVPPTNDNSGRLSVNIGGRQNRNIFVCGFLPTRLHNKQLLNVVQDLMPNFFVCSNPTSPYLWNRKTTLDLLKDANAMVFLLNKFTLNDRNCVTTLQYAYALNVPVIMLRHPSMKLVVNVEVARKSQLNINATILRNAIFDSYQNSIEYEKSTHSIAVQRILKIVQTVSEENVAFSRTTSPGEGFSTLAAGRNLKLPAISPPSRSPLSNRQFDGTAAAAAVANNGTKPNTLSSTVKIRSRSFGNLKNLNFNERANSAPASRQNSAQPMVATKIERYVNPNVEDKNNQKRREMATLERKTFGERQLSSREMTDDPSLYNETQYLVFHLNDKSQKPKLIRFPSDVIVKDLEDDLSSMWGSDTSLEEEAERASRLQGDFNVPTPPSPKPYIDPL